MGKTPRASKPLGLLALVLGLMAFGASGAQAETGAFWEVNGTQLSGSAEVQAKNDTAHTTFLTKVGTSSVEIICGPIKLVGATLSGTGFKGKLHYEECTTKLNGIAASKCTPKTTGASLGSIETNALKGLLKFPESSPDLLELLPETGIPLVELQLGSSCPIGNNFDITGTLFLKDCQAELLQNRTEHLFEEGSSGALLFGGNAMTIDGSFWTFLTGGHASQTFSGHPVPQPDGSFWEVNGAKLGGSAEVQVENDTAHTTILSTSGSSTVEILCGPIKLVGATLSGTGFKGKIHYEECTTLLNGTTVNRCTPKSPGASLGLIETNALNGLIELHEPKGEVKEDVIEVTPESGTSFFTLVLGPLCAIGNEFSITGKLFFKDCQSELLVNKLKHLFEEGPLSAFLFGGNAMTFDGSFWMFLVGAHAGQTFSGHSA
jgi:hypothetical protein